MKTYIITGYKARKTLGETDLCIMEAESAEQVLQQARRYYGTLYVTGCFEVGSVEANNWYKGRKN